MWTLVEWAARTGGQLRGADAKILHYATDSREVRPGSLFIAICGANVDGHDFVRQAYEAGAVGILVERPQGSGPEIIVESVVPALARFASSVRAQFKGPVIGVTGSNGKTTTKEFIAAALAPLGSILKTEGNRNSEFTSPLVWAEATVQEKAAVIEMGMRGFGQITHLAKFSRPTIGVITVVGTAHIQMVGSREGIARAKGELLAELVGDKMSILWAEDDYLPDLRRNAPGPIRTFGFSQDADCRLLGYRADGLTGSIIRGVLDGTQFECKLPVLGRHQANNAAAAILAAHSAGISVAAAAAALERATLPPMRMEVKEINGVRFILDNYNASPDSTVAAIRAISEVTTPGRKLAILGEMKELGDFSESGHRMVGSSLAVSSIDVAMLTGGATRFIADEAKNIGFPADRIKELSSLDFDAMRSFLATARPGDVVLIKGSRVLELERAMEGLS